MKKNKLFVSMLAAGLLSLAPAQAQDVVKLTTGKAIGETVSLQVNQLKSGVVVDWGDGQTQTYSQTEDDNLVISGELKGATITLSSNSKLQTLICEGLELTALDITAAPNLRSLYCQNNNLQTLDLSQCAELLDLNCSNNQLSAITVTATSHPKLENLNIADNGMTNAGNGATFNLALANLQHLDLSNNAFTRLSLSSTSKNLDVVKCANNELSGSLSVVSFNDLSVLMCGNNSLTTLTMKASMPALRQIFAENNQLKRLNLSGAENLHYAAVENNALTQVQLPEKLRFYAYTCGNNQLSFSSMPRRSYVDNISYLPQAETVDITTALRSKTVDGNRVYYALVAPSRNEAREEPYLLDFTNWLFDGSGDKTVEYTYMGREAGSEEFAEIGRSDLFTSTSSAYYGKVAFYKPFEEVYVHLTSQDYTDLEQTTSHFIVVNSEDDVTAIDDVKVNNGENGLTVKPAHGSLQLSASAQQLVRIYSSAGQLVWQGTVDAATTTVQLPGGVYVVNGQKVVL